MPVRTVIEHETKDKRSVAFALDWPGWSRGAKTAEQALATLEAYRARYRTVAGLAAMGAEFDAAGPLEVVEDRVGTGSTDFWGIAFSPSSTEQDPIGEAELERKLRLLRAAWAFFDGVAARVSPEMRKGPRGGGRERDEIIGHVIRVESMDFAKGVGIDVPDGSALIPDGIPGYREAYVAAMRDYNDGKVTRMRSRTLPFLIRHSAFHTLDHAWEMEDKDLSGDAAVDSRPTKVFGFPGCTVVRRPAASRTNSAGVRRRPRLEGDAARERVFGIDAWLAPVGGDSPIVASFVLHCRGGRLARLRGRRRDQG